MLLVSCRVGGCASTDLRLSIRRRTSREVDIMGSREHLIHANGGCLLARQVNGCPLWGVFVCWLARQWSGSVVTGYKQWAASVRWHLQRGFSHLTATTCLVLVPVKGLFSRMTLVKTAGSFFWFLSIPSSAAYTFPVKRFLTSALYLLLLSKAMVMDTMVGDSDSDGRWSSGSCSCCVGGVVQAPPRKLMPLRLSSIAKRTAWMMLSVRT